VLAAAALLAAGCGGEDEAEPEPRAERPAPSKPVPRAECPRDLTGCRTASGRILYVERVDPDGDGDAHFVLASRQGITAPGISVIDVRKDLRPRPLPRPGDMLSAAGRVQVGSYDQRQIEAVTVEVAR
jgi:hypothetical protein